jgi:hypothetical protein
MVEVLLPTFTTGIQDSGLQREGFRPRALSLVMILEGIMVLKLGCTQ